MSDDGISYKKPPKKNRFRKGESGNPSGRPRKKLPKEPADQAGMLVDILSEVVEVDGKRMTKREVLVRSFVQRAMKGEAAAMRTVVKLMENMPTKDTPKGGVLVVPGTIPLEQWTAAAALQQAKYRTKDYPDGEIT